MYRIMLRQMTSYLVYSISSDNILANNEQTDIDKIALATDAINMTISPEVSNMIEF